MTGNNSGESSYYGRRDFPHGRAEHIALYRIMQSQIARVLRTSRANFCEYDFTYFDGFCGSGIFAINENERDEKSPIDESFGSPLVALEALFDFVAKNTINSEKRVIFVFNDNDEEVVSTLKNNIMERLSHYRAQTVNSSFSDRRNDPNYCNIEWNFETEVEDNLNEFFVKIQIHNGRFQDFNNEAIINNKPMVSFVDPFNYSQTPMDSLIRYAGERRMIILNFMVKQVYQNRTRKRNTEADMFGTSEYKNYLPRDFESLGDTERIKAYLEAYKRCFEDKCKDLKNKREMRLLDLSLRNVFRRDNAEKCLYYLLFAAVDLTTMANVKHGMHVVAQNFKLDSAQENNDECELFFSDIRYEPENNWRPTKSGELINKEATIIYNSHRGKEISFGKLKEWILMKTLFQIHSHTLRFLENNEFLEVVNTEYSRLPGVPKYERTSRVFPTHVGKYHDTPGWDKTLKIKYCNGWTLRFADRGEKTFFK